MAFFVDDLNGIQGVGVVRDPYTGNTALESYGPSGVITVEDQNDYYYSLWNPTEGTVLHRTGDTLSGHLYLQSVCAEVYLSDGFFQNYTLTQPTQRALDPFYTNHSIVGNFNEVANKIAISASPGFTWGRSGNVVAGAWLLNDSVPSSVVGRLMFLSNAYIKNVFITNENASTFTVQIYEHDGTTYTLLTSVSLTSQRQKSESKNIAVTFGKELALKISSGSCKNVVAGLIITGELP
jgi:hypothetical protein